MVRVQIQLAAINIRLDLSAAFCTDQEQVNRNVAQIKESIEPLFDFVASDNVRHTVRRVPSEQTNRLVEAFKEIPYLYIADGHHRAAAASRVRQNRKQENPNHTGEEEYNRVLGVIFPAGQMKILPYNRIVKGLNGHDASSFFDAVGRSFDIQKTSKTAPEEHGIVCMYFTITSFFFAFAL